MLGCGLRGVPVVVPLLLTIMMVVVKMMILPFVLVVVAAVEYNSQSMESSKTFDTALTRQVGPSFLRKPTTTQFVNGGVCSVSK